MSRVVVAAGIVGLRLFVEPPLDGLAGYLLFQAARRLSRRAERSMSVECA